MIKRFSSDVLHFVLRAQAEFFQVDTAVPAATSGSGGAGSGGGGWGGGDVDEGTASVLAKYDTDGDKKLSQSELKVMLTSLGFSVDDAYLTGVMTNFDQDASGSIDANEFKALARRSSLLCAPTLSLTLGTPTVTPSLPMFLRIREAFHSLVSYMILLRGLLMRDKALFE